MQLGRLLLRWCARSPRSPGGRERSPRPSLTAPLPLPAGAVVGLFCMNPDAGDYGLWNAEAEALVARWVPYFRSVGAELSLSRGRDTWLQIDINPSYVALGMPAALPGPSEPGAKPPKV